MSDNTITITLDDILGPDGIEGVWDAMVGRLAERAESKFLHSDAGTELNFHQTVLAAINKAVETKIAARIEMLMTQPIQLTDGYGQPKGDPVTFTEMIGQQVAAAMTVKLDHYGKPSSNGTTLFETAVRHVAIKDLEAAVKAEARKVNASAKEAVAAKIAEAISKTLKV